MCVCSCCLCVCSVYKSLCEDGASPLVRRAACVHLGDFAAAVAKVGDADNLLKFVDIVQTLAKDQQDSVRLFLPQGCRALCQYLPEERVTSDLLPVFEALGVDDAWRVRYNVAKEIGGVAQAVGASRTQAVLLRVLRQLHGDVEMEVRAALALEVAAVANVVGASVFREHVLPCISKLAGDSALLVRSSLAQVVVGVCQLASTSEATLTAILSVVEQLLKDPEPDVRLNILACMDTLAKSASIDRLSSSMMPCLIELAQNAQWRVRLKVIGHTKSIAMSMSVDMFNQHVIHLCIGWLADAVSSVRDAAIANLKELGDVYGARWLETFVLRSLLENCQHPNYLFRVTSLRALSTIGLVISKQVLAREVLPKVLNLAGDPVPNVRFNVAFLLRDLKTAIDPADMEGTAVPMLQRLTRDEDFDVRYFAGQALA